MTATKAWRALSLAIVTVGLTSCGGDGSGDGTSYQGTASVGDFLDIVIDRPGGTISYTNSSNGTSGTATFTVAGDGSFTINDPTGNLVTGFEIPGYAVVLQAAKTGPTATTPSLVFAFLKEKITKEDMFGNFNYMQFRTNSGGVEIGSASIDNRGNIATDSYWPYGGATGQPEAFMSDVMDESYMVEDPSLNFLQMNLPDEPVPSYIFATTGGFRAVDTPNGSIICLQQSATKDFDPANAGTYNAIVYSKSGAQTGVGNVETGTVDLDKGTMAIAANANIVLTDSLGNTLANTTITPVADNANLVGPGKMTNPCNGLFNFQFSGGGTTQDVFVVFLNNALLFSSFSYNTGTGLYDYFYGAALKQ